MTDKDFEPSVLMTSLLAERVRADDCESKLEAAAVRLAGFRKRLLEMAEEMATS